MYWKHSFYDIVKNIVGGCHTADEAYRILCELLDDRKQSVDGSKAEFDRSRSKKFINEVNLNESQIDYSRSIHDSLSRKRAKSDILQAKAFLKEYEIRTRYYAPCLEYALKEIEFIEEIKSIVESHRKYRSQSEFVNFQLGYAEEVKYDLVWRAYCEICTMNTISFDTWNAVKQNGEAFVIDSILKIKESRINDLMLKTKRDILGEENHLIHNIPFFEAKMGKIIEASSKKELGKLEQEQELKSIPILK